MKILICDDEYASRLILKSYLDLYNIEVFEASSGEEALRIIEKNNPDLLIIDYHMSGMTGLDVIKKLTQQMPVKVVMTSEGFTKDIERELKIHASGYIVKPVTEEQLIKTIKDVTGVDIKDVR